MSHKSVATVHSLLSVVSEARAYDAQDPFEGYSLPDAPLTMFQVSDLYDFLLWELLSDSVRESGWDDFTEWSGQDFQVSNAHTLAFWDKTKDRVQERFDAALAARQAAVKSWGRAEADLHAAVTSKQFSQARVAKAEAAVASIKPVFDEAAAVFLNARRVEEFIRPVPDAFKAFNGAAVVELLRLHLVTDKWSPSTDSYSWVVSFVKSHIL